MRSRAIPFLLSVLLLAGCARSGITFVDEARKHNQESALELADTVQPASDSAISPADAATARSKALADLRTLGDEAASAADLITATFPSDTQGAPFYVETGTYESTPCVIVLESIGRPGQDLTDTRLWVIGLDSDVLFSAVRP